MTEANLVKLDKKLQAIASSLGLSQKRTNSVGPRKNLYSQSNKSKLNSSYASIQHYNQNIANKNNYTTAMD